MRGVGQGGGDGPSQDNRHWKSRESDKLRRRWAEKPKKTYKQMQGSPQTGEPKHTKQREKRRDVTNTSCTACKAYAWALETEENQSRRTNALPRALPGRGQIRRGGGRGVESDGASMDDTKSDSWESDRLHRRVPATCVLTSFRKRQRGQHFYVVKNPWMNTCGRIAQAAANAQ